MRRFLEPAFRFINNILGKETHDKIDLGFKRLRVNGHEKLLQIKDYIRNPKKIIALLKELEEPVDEAKEAKKIRNYFKAKNIIEWVRIILGWALIIGAIWFFSSRDTSSILENEDIDRTHTFFNNIGAFKANLIFAFITDDVFDDNKFDFLPGDLNFSHQGRNDGDENMALLASNYLKSLYYLNVENLSDAESYALKAHELYLNGAIDKKYRDELKIKLILGRIYKKKVNLKEHCNTLNLAIITIGSLNILMIRSRQFVLTQLSGVKKAIMTQFLSRDFKFI